MSHDRNGSSVRALGRAATGGLTVVLIAPLFAIILVFGLIASVVIVGTRSPTPSETASQEATRGTPVAAPRELGAAPKAQEVATSRDVISHLPAVLPTPALVSIERREPELSAVSRLERRTYEREHDGANTSVDRARLERTVDEPTPADKMVKLEALYGGALEFQGRRYEGGLSPSMLLAPGTHSVRVFHRDCNACITKVHTFTVGPKTPEVLKFRADFKDATLIVNGTAGAAVKVGETSGKVGVPISFQMSQPKRRVNITVSKEGYVAKTISAELSTGAVVEKVVSLSAH